MPKREFVVGFVIGRSFGCLGRARSQHVPRRLATVPAARCGELDQDDQDGKRERNDRVIVIPSWHDRLGELERASELPSALREKIERFFLSTTFFTAKNAKILGWKGPKKASSTIEETHKTYFVEAGL